MAGRPPPGYRWLTHDCSVVSCESRSDLSIPSIFVMQGVCRAQNLACVVCGEQSDRPFCSVDH